MVPNVVNVVKTRRYLTLGISETETDKEPNHKTMSLLPGASADLLVKTDLKAAEDLKVELGQKLGCN